MRSERPYLLADELASPAARRARVVSPRTHDSLTHLLLQAKRFVLDEAAAMHIARLIKRHPRLIADAHDFAIPPFASMWIEFAYPEWFEAITGEMHDHQFGDERVGYLIAGANVYAGAANREGGGWSPIAYRMHRPLTIEQELALADQLGISRIGFDALYWGSAYEALSARDAEAVRVLRANHSFELLPLAQEGEAPSIRVPRELRVQAALKGGCGDLRNIIALLLFLNRTSNIQSIEHLPMAQRMHNRRPAPLLSHSVIKLTVDPEPMMIKLCAGEGIWRRLHDVRGHFCHNRTARENAHDHDWIDVSTGDGHLRWACGGCGGLRWWKREHKRGHEEKGIVTSEYQVGA